MQATAQVEYNHGLEKSWEGTQAMPFAENIKRLRTSAGLSQVELAKKSGVSLGAIRCYEQGLREPLLSAAVELCRALGCRMEDLVADEPKKKPRK